jgi:hypothetical protein
MEVKDGDAIDVCELAAQVTGERRVKASDEHPQALSRQPPRLLHR